MPATMTNSAVSIRNILFPTDFSRASLAALPYALAMAAKFDSRLFPVHISPEPPGLPASVREGLEALRGQPVDDVAHGMALLEQHLPGAGYEMLFRKGDLWTELSEIISAKHMDLVVIGTHGRTGVRKLLLGSVAETIFRNAACPVLTVGPVVSGEPESVADLHEILFATDFSEESLAALPYAISLAQRDGARLYLLHVAPDSLTRPAEELLHARLRNLVPETAGLACEPKAFVVCGTPALEILNFADEMAVDLIVLAVKHTPTFFEVTRRIPMATAYAVVTRSTCPVLTVRAPRQPAR
jgi:nucleotide-binding universal stress UspA family protein